MDAEGRFTEYKEDISNKKNSFKAEIVSFLNSEGGSIYLGVDDNGNPVSFPNEVAKRDKFKEWEETLNNWVTEAFSPSVSGLIFIDTEPDYLVIRVSAGVEKPYYYKDGEGMNTKGIYTRVGSSKRRASDEEIRRMIFHSKDGSWDSNVSPEQDLTFAYAKFKAEEEGIPFDEGGLSLKNKDGQYTNAALVISDQNPFVTKLAVFKGTNDLEFRQKQPFTGSALRQIDEVGLYLQVYNPVRAIISGKFQRDELQSYPELALRELMLNEVCHRDYTFNGDAFVRVYDNRVEFASMGALVGGVSLDDVLDGASSKRNPNILHILDKLGFIENYGRGIKRTVESYEGFSKQPEFRLTTNMFIAIVYNRNYYGTDRMPADELLHEHDENKVSSQTVTTEKVNVNSNDPIVELIKRMGAIKRVDVENEFHISQATAKRRINKLVKDGVILKVGTGYNTSYQLP
jgi:predicted HTH transcriptional regulator